MPLFNTLRSTAGTLHFVVGNEEEAFLTPDRIQSLTSEVAIGLGDLVYSEPILSAQIGELIGDPLKFLRTRNYKTPSTPESPRWFSKAWFVARKLDTLTILLEFVWDDRLRCPIVRIIDGRPRVQIRLPCRPGLFNECLAATGMAGFAQPSDPIKFVFRLSEGRAIYHYHMGTKQDALIEELTYIALDPEGVHASLSLPERRPNGTALQSTVGEAIWQQADVDLVGRQTALASLTESVPVDFASTESGENGMQTFSAQVSYTGLSTPDGPDDPEPTHPQCTVAEADLVYIGNGQWRVISTGAIISAEAWPIDNGNNN